VRIRPTQTNHEIPIGEFVHAYREGKLPNADALRDGMHGLDVALRQVGSTCMVKLTRILGKMDCAACQCVAANACSFPCFASTLPNVYPAAHAECC
jgi:hypothetical protein